MKNPYFQEHESCKSSKKDHSRQTSPLQAVRMWTHRAHVISQGHGSKGFFQNQKSLCIIPAEQVIWSSYTMSSIFKENF